MKLKNWKPRSPKINLDYCKFSDVPHYPFEVKLKEASAIKVGNGCWLELGVDSCQCSNALSFCDISLTDSIPFNVIIFAIIYLIIKPFTDESIVCASEYFDNPEILNHIISQICIY